MAAMATIYDTVIKAIRAVVEYICRCRATTPEQVRRGRLLAAVLALATLVETGTFIDILIKEHFSLSTSLGICLALSLWLVNRFGFVEIAAIGVSSLGSLFIV